MTNTVSVRLDKPLLQDLNKIEKDWQIDRSESIRRLLLEAIKSWKIKIALGRLREHKTSLGKAAKESGISLSEMLNLVKEHKIDWTGYSKEDLEKDLKFLKE